MKKVYKWTYELAKLEAKKYQTKTEFHKKAGGCYMYAVKNNFIDEICSHMITLKKRWTKEKCIEIAKKYEFFNEFRKNEGDAYQASRSHGCENEIKSILKKFSSKWSNKEAVLLEAKKYQSKTDFRKNSKGAYNSCYRNFWVEESCSHMISKPIKIKKIWTQEGCLIEIRKFEYRSDFRKKCSGVYKACLLNNWLLDEIENLKVKLNRNWTKEKCKVLAKKYSLKSEFKKNYNGAYQFASKRGWLEEICSHMESQFIFWTKEKCEIESNKYKSRTEYARKNGASYQFALKQGAEFMNSICSHMEIRGNEYKRLIYAYEFSDKHVYVGLTYNEQKRKEEHSIDGRGPVARYISKSGLVPKYNKLENYIEVKEAIHLEQYYIDKYKTNGWIVLNKSKAGALGGNNTYWTKEKCKEIALEFNRKEDLRFAPGFGGLYNAARKKGWWDEICCHMTGGNTRWTKEKIKLLAKQFKTRGAFGKKEPSAYSTAIKNGWLEEVCYHM